MKKIFALIFTAFVFCSGLFAEPSFNMWGSGEVFKLDVKTDSVLMGSGVLLSGGALYLDKVVEWNRADYNPEEIYNKDNLNFLDRSLMQSYNKNLDTAADAAVAAAMLSPAVLVFTDKEEWLTIGVMYAETLLIANGVKELTKLCASRARPYVYFDSEKPQDDLEDGDWCKSFPSGHSTMAFAGATFATYTFAEYFPDSNWKYAVAAGSYALAAGTACLRVASGNHFPTDVLAGAVLGSGIGFAVPWLHTFNSKHNLKINAAANGVSFVYRPGSAL